MSGEARKIPMLQVMADANQPRQRWDDSAIADLARSMSKSGLLQPVRVFFDSGRDHYILMSGESRYRAALRLGWTEIDAIVVDRPGLSEEDRLADQLTENMIRNDLSPIDEAKGIAKLKALKGCTSKQLADEYGFSTSALSRAEALLKLPESLQAKVGVGRGWIPASAAVELARIEDPASQMELADAILSGSLTRDQVASKVREAVGSRANRSRRIPFKLGNVTISIASEEETLSAEGLLDALDTLRRAARKVDKTADASLITQHIK